MTHASIIPIAKNVESVLQKIEKAYEKVVKIGQPYPILVAVSKTMPAEYVIEAYKAGQRIFGENYIQELVEKSHNDKLIAECPDIRWHYIGKLQSNKLKMITRVPNLSMVETVSSLRMADILDKTWAKVSDNPLDILIQVNTSKEEQKGGVEVSAVTDFYKIVSETCRHLRIRGIMTIGQYGYDSSLGTNPDFVCLHNCRKNVSQFMGIDEHSLILSMGMSSDYEMAIELGSTMVRVGSHIFGSRQ